MGTITISLPRELEKTMKEFERLKMISSKIKISDSAAKKFTDKISIAVAGRLRGE